MKTNKICIYLLVFIFIMSCVPIPPEDNHLNAIAINKSIIWMELSFSEVAISFSAEKDFSAATRVVTSADLIDASEEDTYQQEKYGSVDITILDDHHFEIDLRSLTVDSAYIFIASNIPTDLRRLAVHVKKNSITTNFIDGLENLLSAEDYSTLTAAMDNDEVIFYSSTTPLPPPTVNYRCVGDVPSNASFCLGDSWQLPDNTAITIVESCTPNQKCEYTCNENFMPLDGDCVPVEYFCQGDIPTNAIMCGGDNENLDIATTRELVSSCSSSQKCEYTCANGYMMLGVECVEEDVTYSCLGIAPANASICSGDDENVPENTSKIVVSSCTAQKCEYTCQFGFKNIAGRCIEDIQELPGDRLNILSISGIDATGRYDNKAKLLEAFKKGKVLIPAGAIIKTSSLTVDSTLDLVIDGTLIINGGGTGLTVKGSNSRLAGSGLIKSLNGTEFHYLLNIQGSRTVIDGLHISTDNPHGDEGDGTNISYGRGAILINTTDDVVIRNCDISNWWGAGIYANGDNIQILGNKIHRNTFGIWFHGKNILIDNNLITNNRNLNTTHGATRGRSATLSGASGILSSHESDGMIFTNNEVSYNSEHGTYIHTSNATITDNYVHHNSYQGIKADSTGPVLIKDNIVKFNDINNGAGDIYIQARNPMQNVIVKDNIVTSYERDEAIYLSGGRVVSIRSAIYQDNSSCFGNSQIVNNQISAGLFIQWTNNVLVSGNNVPDGKLRYIPQLATPAGGCNYK